MKSSRCKRARRKARPKAKPRRSTVSAKPGKAAARPQSTIEDGGKEAAVSSKKRKAGLSPEALEKIGKLLPGIIEAVAKLIDAISKLR